MKRLLAATLILGLAACASAPKKPGGVAGAKAAEKTAGTAQRHGNKSPYPAAQEDLAKRGHYTAGGLYAPHIADSTPDIDIDVSLIPEPEVVVEPRSAYGNRPVYSVLGKNYRVLDDTAGYVEQGVASFYGNKFHGRRTSNMEVYDMYAFTAAHKSLPLPSFARVTNMDNGESVVVRVNDRGPFHDGRVVDLSYAAALKLGITRAGTGRVEVRALQPGEGGVMYADAGSKGKVDTRTAALNAAPQATPVGAPVNQVPNSSMDMLVAALPAAAIGAGVGAGTSADSGAAALPPGVRIATGKPTRMAATPAAKTKAVATQTPAPPAGTADAKQASASAVDAAPAGESWRFDMNQDGRTMTADEFDAWMEQRKVRVATGHPGKADPAVPASKSTAAIPPPATIVTAAAPVVPATRMAGAAGNITLQVASFAARDNADRALAMLRGAGIDHASLHDATANGQKVWRLRVGPLEAGAANGLATRIASLGFGAPQRVTE